MTSVVAAPWESKRTEETRSVERVLNEAGFQHADAYRYNSASIRVRVIDSRFEGIDHDERDKLIEPCLDLLPEETQVDIINLFLFSPSEVANSDLAFRSHLINAEFENPSPSML